MIKKINHQFIIMSASGKKRLGSYPTKAQALHRLRQIEWFKNKGK
jgi:hypothetical protein